MFLIFLIAVAVGFIVISTSVWKVHPFIALILAAIGFGLFSGMPPQQVIASVQAGFGGTVGAIGLVILAGAIIGVFLEKSGGALALATNILKVTGEKHIPFAMAIVGYVVSMPVFCDTAFIILSPLNKALSKKAGVSVAAGAVALSLGLYATHTMVPPTPGPVAAAGILGADLGSVILWGLLVSSIALAAGWLFAVKVASSIDIITNEPVSKNKVVPEENHQNPSVFSSLLPILLPLVLILGRSVAKLPDAPLGNGSFYTAIDFIGHPVIALIIGVAAALPLAKPYSRKLLSADGWVGEAVLAAAPIIIITAAGGAFGKVLQAANIGDLLGEYVNTINIGIFLPFVIAAILKTAQGSSTVAIITTASLTAPFLATLGLDSETGRALAVVTIGAGAMVISHANDSYFWVVTQFTGMDVKQGYKLQSLGTLIEGTTAAVTVWVISLFVL